MRARFVAWVAPRDVYDWIIVVVCATLFSVTGYWAIVDRQPVEQSESEILTPEVVQGGTFSVRYKVKWNSSCRVTGYRFVIDSAGQQYTVAPDQRLVHPWDAPDFIINVPIPLSAKPGPAMYRATIIYECNPLQWFFPLEKKVPDKFFNIAESGEAVPALTPRIECTPEKPVFVRAYCRRVSTMPHNVH